MIKKLIVKNWLLIVILLLATVLRLWKLGSIPPHLTPDEAALGYNAYSILKTGRDEHGEILPIIFKSFGDYKPGFYVYLTIPSIAIFDLNEFAVRLPGALAGILAVWLLYLIVKSLFKDKKLAIFVSFILSINPWHILFSRGAWEVNIALTLTLAGIYFFLKSLKENKYLILSALFFGLTLITYQGAKLSSGIVVLILLILYAKEVLKFDRKILAKSAVLGLIISLPIILSFFQGKTGRLSVFSLFSYPRKTEILQKQLNQGEEKIGDLSYYLFHSETVNFGRGILTRFFNHFSGRFLFFEGDWENPKHNPPNHGMLLIGDLILLIVGFVSLLKRKNKKTSLFIFLWLLLAPLPSILSRDQVHAIRSLNLVIPLVIISGFGLHTLWSKFIRARWLFAVLYALSFIYFLDAYFVHLPIHDSRLWDYGYKQIVETVASVQDEYKVIKVQQSFTQPYIYFLFFQKYDPVKYQAQVSFKEGERGDVGQVERLDNIDFAPIDWSLNRIEKGVLFVADPIRIPPSDSNDENLFRILREIKYLDGSIAFRILEVL